jgi:hypothetical protein
MQHATRWDLMVGPDAAIGYLVQLLLEDGLRVDPFIAHPALNGDLHRRGLSASEWLEWLRRVVYARLLAGPDAEIHPVLQWRGNPSLKPTLADLWDRYLASYPDLWRSLLQPNGTLFGDRAVRSGLFKRGVLGADRSYGLPMFRIFVIHYPAPVLYMATPDAAVLSIGPSAPVPAELARAIAGAAEQQRLMHNRSAGD